MIPQQGYQQGYAQQTPQVVVVQPGMIQQPVFVQPGMVHQAPHHGKPLSGFERINKEGIYIKQKIDIAEIASGCERENSYSIFNMDKATEKTGVELLRAREKSNCCARQIFSGGCRPFVMNIQLRDNDPAVHNQPFLELERPCTCTCLCFARPEVLIHHVEGGKRTYLGKLVNPWACNCDLNLEVYDASNLLMYKIKAACCQSGVMYGKYPCQSCQTVNFMVNTANSMPVATIQKRTAGCCASMVSNADNWAVTFPNNATVETKALLMSAGLFLDYLFFEKAGLGGA